MTTNPSDKIWEKSDEYRKYTGMSHAVEFEHRLLEKQSEKFDSLKNNAELQSRSDGIAFVKLYLTSLKGLNLTSTKTRSTAPLQYRFFFRPLKRIKFNYSCYHAHVFVQTFSFNMFRTFSRSDFSIQPRNRLWQSIIATPCSFTVSLIRASK